MSTSDFTKELVAMAQSHEELPHVRKALAHADRLTNELANTIQKREESILALKAQIEQLQGEKRNLEVARDDAELRFLEAEDKINHVLNLVKGSVETLAPHLRVMEPPKEPEPVTEPQGQGERDFTSPTTTPTDAFVDTPQPSAVHSEANASTGQSESAPTSAHPTPTTTGTESAALSYEAPPANWEDRYQKEESVFTTELPKPQPYSGKLYKDVPGYISKEDWINGGGTLENYYSNV